MEFALNEGLAFDAVKPMSFKYEHAEPLHA